MIDEILVIYKPQGVTPLQLINQLKKDKPEFKDHKIGFAGRLDPLARGVMLLTIGEANKNREPLLKLTKTYEFSVLFGVETDTYDYLGILKSFSVLKAPTDINRRIKKFVKENTGKFSQPYPPFSSKTIYGVPLFKLAKRQKLKIEDLPLKEIEIFNFKLISVNKISSQIISQEILQNLQKIKGFFRQKRIIKYWQKFFEINRDHDFITANFEIECSSGTYVRSLANRMGQVLGCSAIAFEIYRTKVGDFDIKDSLN